MKKKQTHFKTHFEVFTRLFKNRTNLFLTFSMLACFTIFISCNDDEKKVTGQPYDPNKPILLTSFQPDSGRISEMVLLDGANFGTDTSLINVYFNSSKASVISSIGSRMLVLTPRLPGDTCIITVEVGDQKEKYTQEFYYHIEASVTTLAGNGQAPGDDGPIYNLGLDKAIFTPVYIGMDADFNIFVTDTYNNLVRINELDNSIDVIATGSQGLSHRCAPYAHPVTNVLIMGAEGENNRDRFITLDPKTGWVPKLRFIKEWDFNGYTAPKGGANENHFGVVYCPADGNLYTRYQTGLIARINPTTWKATAIGMTPSGIAYGVAMHPIRTNELWIAYSTEAGQVNNSICRLDVLNDSINTETGLLASFEKLSGAINGAHRDGPLGAAQFHQPRMIGFDVDGNLYVGDNQNHCIRLINTETMMVETIIGVPENAGFKDGAKEEALFREPHGIVTDKEGIIYVADYGNKRIRRIAIE